MEYSPAVRKLLDREKIKVGERVSIEKDGKSFEAVVMPNTGQPDLLVIKLGSGYNSSISPKGLKIRKVRQPAKPAPKKPRQDYDPGKKTILIINTGGTVASRIDYETGAVKPSITSEDLLVSVPEMAKIANIRTEILFQMLSEDMEPEHWMAIAEKIVQEHGRFDGIIITHGTDTMHYTSAALSFMLSGIKKPIILVGSQRSSDRGSSDAVMNLLCAAHFIVSTDFTGVAVCMHASMDDDYCFVHSGLHVRKMHTSRRDAFRSIDVPPIAKVSAGGSVEFMSDFPKGEFKPIITFSKKVALVKMRPGFSHKELEFYEKNGYKGLIIEGTGMGHAPVNSFDKHTRYHSLLLSAIRRMSKTMVIVMTSQCLYGKVNLNVYSTGRSLQEAGVLPVQMTPETAFVKLGWILGQTKNVEAARNLFAENMMGEIVERIDPKMFLF